MELFISVYELFFMLKDLRNFEMYSLWDKNRVMWSSLQLNYYRICDINIIFDIILLSICRESTTWAQCQALNNCISERLARNRRGFVAEFPELACINAITETGLVPDNAMYDYDKRVRGPPRDSQGLWSVFQSTLTMVGSIQKVLCEVRNQLGCKRLNFEQEILRHCNSRLIWSICHSSTDFLSSLL